MLADFSQQISGPGIAALFGLVDQTDLKRRSTAAVQLNLAAQATMFLPQIRSTAGLSRILDPKQFGLAAMASIACFYCYY